MRILHLLAWAGTTGLSLAHAAANPRDAEDCAVLATQALPGARVLQVSAVAAGAATADTVPLPAHCVLQGETTPRTGVDGVRYSIGF